MRRPKMRLAAVPVIAAVAAVAIPSGSASADGPKPEPPEARFDIHLPIPIHICLSEASPDADKQVIEQLRQSFKPYFPDVDVQSECASDASGSDKRQQYGVWERKVAGKDLDARKALLKTLPTIRQKKAGGDGLEDFAASFASKLVERAVDNKWNQIKSTPIDGTGMSNTVAIVGNISLASKSPVSFQAPDKIELDVKASAQITPVGIGPFPYDVDVSIVDTMFLRKARKPQAACGANAAFVACTSEKSYDVPALGQSGALESASVPSIGCPFARGLPVSVPIPKFLTNPVQKLVFDYDRVRVDGTGITAGAAIVQCPRSPRVLVQGPQPIIVQGQKTVHASIAISAEDMRPPLNVFVDGKSQTINGTTGVVGVTVAVPENFRYMTDVAVGVSVTDADGLSAGGKTTVPLQLDPHDTPACRNKPYLPQCKP